MGARCVPDGRPPCSVGDAPVPNPTYLDCATHHGCPMAPGHVGKGQEKGRVENGAGYVPKPCRAGRAMPDFSALNPAARYGRATVANGRLHGATRAPPTGQAHLDYPVKTWKR